jgi:hypothetical protein
MNNYTTTRFLINPLPVIVTVIIALRRLSLMTP